MKTTMTGVTIILSLCISVAMAHGQPPQQAYDDCKGKKAGDKVLHTTPEGEIPATCMESKEGLVARPDRKQEKSSDSQEPKPRSKQNPQSYNHSQQYSIEQAVSDQAQLSTIAFSGLAFLTGSFESDTFLPPGKVSDYFGFQYMRDIDAAGRGHNTSFLTRIANNMLAVLNTEQKTQLLTLAKDQQDSIRKFAEKRFPLIMAFRRNLRGDLPAGRIGLDRKAIMKYSSYLYEMDGLMAFERARVLGSIIRDLDSRQRAELAKLKFGDSRTWPDVPDQLNRRGLQHDVEVAIMTYASEMFSWYAGSLDADSYFCPERHGMYFGGFGMKTAPAIGKRDYSISTSLTGDKGQALLSTLTYEQQALITDILKLQRNDLVEIVNTRRTIATELRRFQKGESADMDKVLSLSRRYGELDGELSYYYATAFTKIGNTLTIQQKEKLAKMRTSSPSDPKGPFLYSSPISMPKIGDFDSLFGLL